MSNKALDVFGEKLMSQVRDEAIDDWERILRGKMKDSESKEVYKVLESSFNPEQIEFVRSLLKKVVDTTLHHLLWTLEQEETIDVSVKLETETVSSIRDVSDGLSGELYTEDGWIARFSKKY